MHSFNPYRKFVQQCIVNVLILLVFEVAFLNRDRSQLFLSQARDIAIVAVVQFACLLITVQLVPIVRLLAASHQREELSLTYIQSSPYLMQFSIVPLLITVCPFIATILVLQLQSAYDSYIYYGSGSYAFVAVYHTPIAFSHVSVILGSVLYLWWRFYKLCCGSQTQMSGIDIVLGCLVPGALMYSALVGIVMFGRFMTAAQGGKPFLGLFFCAWYVFLLTSPIIIGLCIIGLHEKIVSLYLHVRDEYSDA